MSLASLKKPKPEPAHYILNQFILLVHFTWHMVTLDSKNFFS